MPTLRDHNLSVLQGSQPLSPAGTQPLSPAGITTSQSCRDHNLSVLQGSQPLSPVFIALRQSLRCTLCQKQTPPVTIPSLQVAAARQQAVYVRTKPVLHNYPVLTAISWPLRWTTSSYFPGQIPSPIWCTHNNWQSQATQTENLHSKTSTSNTTWSRNATKIKRKDFIIYT